MATRELTPLDQVIPKLKERGKEGAFPPYCRLCEGFETKRNDELVSRRLFIGDYAIWIELGPRVQEVKDLIEKQGYEVIGEQRVPDGFTVNYDSVYYKLPGAK